MCIRWTMVAAVLAATVAGGAGATDEPQQALRVVAAVDVGGAPSGMVVADGDLWVSLAVDGVVRIDQATNTVVARIDRPMVWRWPQVTGPSGRSTSSADRAASDRSGHESHHPRDPGR